MKITTITLLFFIFSCLIIWRITWNFKREDIGIRSVVIWISIWTIIGISSIFPSLLDFFVKMAQMEERIYFILLIAVFFMLFQVFNMTIKLEKIKRENMSIFQEITIMKYINKYKSEN